MTRDMAQELDWIERAGARPKGFRPDYTGDFSVERLTSIVMALTIELSVTRDRLDGLERLLAEDGVVKPERIANWAPDGTAAEERGEARRAYLARMMRGMQQAMEAMQSADPPIDDICAELSRSS